MKIQYRFAKSQDAERLSQLLDELGYTVSAEEVCNNLISIRALGGEVLVASCESGICGCVNVMRDVRLAEGKSGEIATLVVDSRFRGSGIGKGLVEVAMLWHSQYGCTCVRIRANAVRSDAHRFYKNLGFKEIKTQKVFITQL